MRNEACTPHDQPGKSGLDARAEHAAVAALLPWSLAGTLDDAEQAMVQRHLGACAACREELAWQAELRAAMPIEREGGTQFDTALDVDAAFARLRPRLEADSKSPLQRPHRAPAALPRHWLGWLAAFEAVALAAVVALLIWPASPWTPSAATPEYRALGAGAVRSGELVLQFRADTDQREMQRILANNGARIIDGPTAQGAYVLTVRGAAPEAVAQALRQEPAVILAAALAAPPSAAKPSP